MRQFRARADVAERPEARVIDRVLVAALGLHLRSVQKPDAVRLLGFLHSLAQAGLEAEGYDATAARVAVASRLKAVVDASEDANSVRVAARRQADGLPAAGRRVRHSDRLATV